MFDKAWSTTRECFRPLVFSDLYDLPFFINSVALILFADDTTFFKASDSLENLISTFTLLFKELFEWCKHNRIDLNVSKTFIMFVTRRRIALPTEVICGDFIIKVVEKFKLLGVTIDDKLIFARHVSNTSIIINYKLNSIKKLFYLCTTVKVQFFKSFILPYFDYCLSLSIYYSKSILQKLCNSYNICLFKLFNSTKTDKFNFKSSENELLNKFLKRFNIFSFTHRVFIKLNLFFYKNFSNENPPILFKKFTDKKTDSLTITKILRSNISYSITETNSKLKFGDLTFYSFYTKFYNKFKFIFSSNCNINLFKKKLILSIDENSSNIYLIYFS